MKYTTQWLLDEMKQGKKFDFLGFWGNKNDTKEEKTFSNFYKSKFTVDIFKNRQHTFECSEQYFMYRKAIEFEDYETAEKILANGLSPSEYKSFGRMVKNYDDKKWNEIRYGVMIDGLRHKFNQNETLKQYLLKTGNKIIVEASPVDTIWGVGLAKVNKQGIPNNIWKNPSKWNGQNFLGFALMELRDEIK